MQKYMSLVLCTTRRAKISNDVILHDQYTQKTKDVATRRVTIINLISIVYVQAEKTCNSSMKTIRLT